MRETYEWSDYDSAVRHMLAMDADGAAYVVEALRLRSGVVLRGKTGPGLNVHMKSTGGLVVSSDDCEPFNVPPDAIAAVVVLPLDGPPPPRFIVRDKCAPFHVHDRLTGLDLPGAFAFTFDAVRAADRLNAAEAA